MVKISLEKVTKQDLIKLVEERISIARELLLDEGLDQKLLAAARELKLFRVTEKIERYIEVRSKFSDPLAGVPLLKVALELLKGE